MMGLDQYGLDINWYFTDESNNVCVATSAGGTLPTPVIENYEINEQFDKIVNELPKKFKVITNKNVFKLIQGITDENLYFESFKDLASRGLYVFDKLNLDDPENGEYLLVAYPDYNMNINKCPVDTEIISLIPNIKHPVILRLEQTILNESFTPIDLIKILNNIN